MPKPEQKSADDMLELEESVIFAHGSGYVSTLKQLAYQRQEYPRQDRDVLRALYYQNAIIIYLLEELAGKQDA